MQSVEYFAVADVVPLQISGAVDLDMSTLSSSELMSQYVMDMNLSMISGGHHAEDKCKPITTRNYRKVEPTTSKGHFRAFSHMGRVV